MSNLLATYRAGGPGHDEMLQASGAAKDAWERLAGAAGLQSWTEVSARRDDVVSLLADQGVRSGADSSDPWDLDPLPVILDDAEWRRLEIGLSQRALLFDAILADLYGSRMLLREGVIPPEIVLGHPGFIRAADGIRLDGDRQLFSVSTHLARNADGAWSALADTTDILTGLGYAMADRRAISEVLAGAYQSIAVRRLGPFFHTVRQSLANVSPVDTPRVVFLVPGTKPTTFDQAYLADALGLAIVNPSDLIVADGRLWLRTLGDVEPVDVLLRELASAESDPVDLTSTAFGGVPGLLEAAHSGSVAVVNPIGAGVLESPALRTYLPRISRHLFDADLALPSAVTYWCGERSMGSHVIAHLDRLIISSVTTGARVNGWELSIGERADLATRISATPHLWVGQEPVEISTTPSVGMGELSPRPTTIRTFAIADGDTYTIMPGGLATTSAPGGSVNLSESAKDVWVLTGGTAVTGDDQSEPSTTTGAIMIAVGTAGNLFQFGTYLESAEATVRRARERRASMPECAAALADLARSAHLVRDHLTPEAWRALGALEQPAPLAQHMVNLAALGGVVNESIIRDHGWFLLDLGRRLRRARFITSTFADFLDQCPEGPVPGNSEPVNQLMRLHDSLLTFRRRSQFRAPLPALVELLFLDPTSPRSFTFTLEKIAGILRSLPDLDDQGRIHTLVADLQEIIAEAELDVLTDRSGHGQNALGTSALSNFLGSIDWRVDKLTEVLGRQQFAGLGSAVWSAEPAEGDN